MNLPERLQRYAAIEAARKRPLIVYATSTRHGVSSMMAGDAVRGFIDQMNAIGEGAQVDVLIHSVGGDALTAWKLMSILRERFEHVSVLVPFMAFSAATLFALGADEIVMHPHASLGPIDPQITVNFPDGKQRRFSYEDVGAFLRFLKEETGITEQAPFSTILDKLFAAVDPLVVGAAKRASELSSSVGERLLTLHMQEDADEGRAKQIAENLNKSFFNHGDSVSRRRARDLNLKIAKDDKDLEALIWDAYRGIEDYMELREPFSPQRVLLCDPAAATALAPVGPISLPPNTPPQVAQSVWTTVANQAVTQAQAGGATVEFSIVSALIESVRSASEYLWAGTITGFRTPTGELKMTLIDREGSWKPVAIPGPTV